MGAGVEAKSALRAPFAIEVLAVFYVIANTTCARQLASQADPIYEVSAWRKGGRGIAEWALQWGQGRQSHLRRETALPDLF